MLRKACTVAYQLASRPHARRLISIERPELGQLSCTGFRGLPAWPSSGGIKSIKPACKLSTTTNYGTSLDDMDDTMMDIRARLASIEGAQQEQLMLQRDMADDLDALQEDSDNIKNQLAIMQSAIVALTETLAPLTETLAEISQVLAALGGDESAAAESSGGPEQASQPKGAGDVSQPESIPEKSQG